MPFHQKIFFSIIIPTFDSSATIKSCLESILNQSFLYFEVCIIDGFSSDNTIEIVKEYSSQYPNIHFVSEKDNGIYDAMNKGIQLAKGEWIYFLGSDDLIHHKDVLQAVYSLDKSEYQVVYGNAKIIGKTAWAKEGQLYDGEFDLQKLLKKNICQQAMFYHKRSFANKTSLFNIDYEICADWDFNLRCWARKEFLFLNMTIVDFYGGGASTRKNANQKFYDDFDKNITKYFGPHVLKKNLPEILPAQPELTIFHKILVWTTSWIKRKLKYNTPEAYDTERQ
jgi:glycosyltransferase involved in cell wall biosynthesis